jgi:hypothetical protein
MTASEPSAGEEEIEMSFMDKAKAAAERARAKAQEGVEEVQARKELAQAYRDLGHKAYELASRGAISSPELDSLVQQISALEAREGSDGGSATGGAPGEGSTASSPDTPA